jgi:hypothetical protein
VGPESKQASTHSTKRSKLVDGKRRIQIPSKWTLMSGCSQPEVCCRECTLAMSGLDTKLGNKRLQAANQTGVSKKDTHFWEVVPQWIPVAKPETRYTKPNEPANEPVPLYLLQARRYLSPTYCSLRRTSFLLRASPMVLPMWSCTVKLDEENLTYAGLAQENGFGPA